MKRWRKEEQQKPRLSVVVATYKKPRELELVLEGYRRQSLLKGGDPGFELIIADDGSGPEIETLCQRFAQDVEIPVTYLWQEDRGWGKPRMLNWATLEARAERVVYTDADCVPHRHFVKAHLEESRPGTVSCGRRVDLFEKASAEMDVQAVRAGTLESWNWLAKRMARREIDFGQQGFYLPYYMARALRTVYRAPRLLGSNMGVDKSRVLEVNGFDESFTVPGVGEDTDMQRRFQLIGLKIKWTTYRAVQYHLWHALTEVGQKAHEIFENLRNRWQVKAAKGIQEFLPLFQTVALPTDLPPKRSGKDL